MLNARLTPNRRRGKPSPNGGPARALSLAAIAAAVVLAGVGEALATDYVWQNPTGGPWSIASNWLPAQGAPPNGLADTAAIGMGLLTVTVSDRFSVGSLALSDPQAVIRIDDDARLSVGAGGVTNHGLIRIRESGGLHFISPAQSAQRTISGAGRIVLEHRRAEVEAAPGILLTIEPSQTISGGGKVSADLTLRGSIIADNPDHPLAIESTNLASHGSIIARDGGVILLNGTNITQHPGSILAAEPGGLLRLDTAIVHGGALSGLGGIVMIDTQAMIEDVALEGEVGVPGGAQLIAAGPTLNSAGGNTTLGGAGPIAGISEFVCFEPLTLLGAGGMTLTPALTPDGLAITPRLTIAPGASLTIGDGYTLAGDGAILGDTIVGVPGTADATIRPGFADAPGGFDIAGSLSVTSAGVLHFDLLALDQFDRLAISGPLMLGGRIEVALPPEFTPVPNQAFTLITAASIAGAFDQAITPIVDGRPMILEVTATAVILRANGCAPDFNADGELNPDDLSDFITCFFLDIMFPGSCPAADFTADGARDPDDLSEFITSFFLGC